MLEGSRNGVKNQGNQTRKNSVSRVTAPTVPAAQARTIARARAGGARREGTREGAVGQRGPARTLPNARPACSPRARRRAALRPRRPRRPPCPGPQLPTGRGRRGVGVKERAPGGPDWPPGPPAWAAECGRPGLGGLKSGRETKAAGSLLGARSPCSQPPGPPGRPAGPEQQRRRPAAAVARGRGCGRGRGSGGGAGGAGGAARPERGVVRPEAAEAAEAAARPGSGVSERALSPPGM
uniref:Uncharacterized protein LOC112808672 n=1 Tax=Callorhinus ursinus TaxID=34884 RepID=A0A3Q7ML25_CALUR|nr:uncharacterized protein LOC112808672 [Callorhinus ursinus]